MAQLIDTMIDGTLEVLGDVTINTDLYFEDTELEELYGALNATSTE